MSKRRPEIVVGGLVFNQRDELLLIKSNRWSGLYSFPGGHVEYGEALLDALSREILEETQLKITDATFLGVQENVEDATYYREAHLIMLNYVCHVDNEMVVLDSEATNYVWVTVDEALSFSLSKSAIDAIRRYQAAVKTGSFPPGA